MAVGACARASSAGLDSEEIVEQGHDVVVVQLSLAVMNHEGHDAQPRGRGIAQDAEVGASAPGIDRAPDQIVLSLHDRPGAHRLLELEHQACPYRADDRRRPPSSRSTVSEKYRCSTLLT